MGRPKGSKNKPRLHLKSEVVEDGKKPTPAQRMQAMKRQVVLMTADSMSPEKIAAVMGLSVEKLRAVFAHELEHGREIVRAEELMRLDAQSGEGKTAATKAMLANAGGARSSGEGGGIPASTAEDDINMRALRVLQGGRT